MSWGALKGIMRVVHGRPEVWISILSHENGLGLGLGLVLHDIPFSWLRLRPRSRCWRSRQAPPGHAGTSHVGSAEVGAGKMEARPNPNLERPFSLKKTLIELWPTHIPDTPKRDVVDFVQGLCVQLRHHRI